VENELQDELPNIHNNCVHGVGHGTTAWLLEQPENWGDFMRTASAGTKVCETLYTEPNDLENCYDGVFNELHLDVLNYEYGMDFGAFMEKDDPFYYCQLQEERHKEACYFEFIGIFWKIFDNDLLAATDYIIENVHDLQKRGPRTVSKIAADWIQNDIVKDSWEVNIQACRNVPSYLQKKCIQGIANGFIQHGEPNNLHLKGFAFCAADYLTEEERGICYSSFIGMLRWVYEEDLYLTACGILPEEVSIQYCTKHSVR
jgi:hypothetical protein